MLSPLALSILVLVKELEEEPELVPELGMVDDPELELAVGDLELAVDWLLAELELVTSELLVLSVSVGYSTPAGAISNLTLSVKSYRLKK